MKNIEEFKYVREIYKFDYHYNREVYFHLWQVKVGDYYYIMEVESDHIKCSDIYSMESLKKNSYFGAALNDLAHTIGEELLAGKDIIHPDLYSTGCGFTGMNLPVNTVKRGKYYIV